MLVSVVIPLYNKKGYIYDTLCSVFSQRYNNFELILVDDGSTDGSIDVVRQFEDPRLRILSQANAGLSEARNTGIRASRGELVAFLDADDLWDEGHLDAIVAVAQAFPEVGLVGTRYRILRETGVISSPHYATGLLPSSDGVVKHFFQAMAQGDPVFMPSAAALRRSSVERVGFFRGRYGEDTDMWIRMARAGEVALSAETSMTYRLFLDDPTSTGRKKRTLDDLKSPHFTEWPKFIGQGNEWYDEFVAKKQIQQLTYYALAGYGSQARQHLRSLRTTQFRIHKWMLWIKSWLPPGFVVGLSRAKHKLESI